jgi:DNA-binding IscR family transcriptional regulator
MNPLDLFDYLLERRYDVPDGVLVDCLAIAQLNPKPSRIYSWQTLLNQLQCCSQSHLSKKLGKLRAAGLVDIEAGGPGCPGYVIRRVGPA